MSLNILLAGQKYFGAEVFRAVNALPGVSIVAVVAPKNDRLSEAAYRAGLRVIPAGTLNARVVPDGIDLIVAAHSHDFIGEATRHRARFGGIGYHPSLLPLHRGRDAIRWAIRMRERVTGGSVYRLSNTVDGGNILAQRHVFIRPGDTERELWERELCPLGVELLSETVARYASGGYQHGTEQDNAIATWEPGFGVTPLYRPDLVLLPSQLSTNS